MQEFFAYWEEQRHKSKFVGFSGQEILDLTKRMFVLCDHDFCALSRVSFEDTALTLLLKYSE